MQPPHRAKKASFTCAGRAALEGARVKSRRRPPRWPRAIHKMKQSNAERQLSHTHTPFQRLETPCSAVRQREHHDISLKNSHSGQELRAHTHTHVRATCAARRAHGKSSSASPRLLLGLRRLLLSHSLIIIIIHHHSHHSRFSRAARRAPWACPCASRTT